MLTANQRTIFCEEWERFIGTEIPGEPDTVHGNWKLKKHQWNVDESYLETLEYEKDRRRMYRIIASQEVRYYISDGLGYGKGALNRPFISLLDVYNSGKQIGLSLDSFPHFQYIDLRMRNIWASVWNEETEQYEITTEYYNEIISELYTLCGCTDIFHTLGSRSSLGHFYLMKNETIIYDCEHTSSGFIDDSEHFMIINTQG